MFSRLGCANSNHLPGVIAQEQAVGCFTGFPALVTYRIITVFNGCMTTIQLHAGQVKAFAVCL